MLDELNKMYTIRKFYITYAKSFVQLCKGNSEYSAFVNNTKDFVDYLPITRLPELQQIKRSTIPLLEGDSMGMAYILAEDELPKWIRADIARIYRVPWVYTDGIPGGVPPIDWDPLPTEVTVNIYNNVHIGRRRRWGLFL